MLAAWPEAARFPLRPLDHVSHWEPPISPVAFIWDFDGTLADTRLRNYRIVRRLLPEASGRPIADFPALATFEVYERTQRRYVNWRDLYSREFGLSEDEVDRFGRQWGEYQLAERTPATIFEGLPAVLEELGGVAHGVVSQNARAQIVRVLEAGGIADRFGAVIGYDDVHLTRQKPMPDGFLACLAALGARSRLVVGIGDHETDVRCARNAQRALAARGESCDVVTIAARFVDGEDPVTWSARPDHVARSPDEVLAIVRGYGLDGR